MTRLIPTLNYCHATAHSYFTPVNRAVLQSREEAEKDTEEAKSVCLTHANTSAEVNTSTLVNQESGI